VTRFATRGGHRLSYESIGAEDGIAVLGLHDLLADRGQLRPLAADLPLDRFRLTLPDARGHGASPMISGRTYPTAELVADVLAVLDAEGLNSVHIAAVGWAAGTALGLAATVPERVTSLVLAVPFLPTLIGDDEMQDTLRQAAAAAEKGQTDKALDLYFGIRMVEADWRDGLPKARLAAMRRAAGNLAPLLAGTTNAPFAAHELNETAIPVTILIAEGAPVSERQMAESVAAFAPRARFTVLPRQPAADRILDSVAAALAETLGPER
jgi:pimeloyl-ACP methyl ester carboxylesterase